MKPKKNADRLFPVVFTLAMCAAACMMVFFPKPALSLTGSVPGYSSPADSCDCCTPVLPIEAAALSRRMIADASAKVPHDAIASHSATLPEALNVQAAQRTGLNGNFQTIGVL
jgi:hypothetical protein